MKVENVSILDFDSGQVKDGEEDLMAFRVMVVLIEKLPNEGQSAQTVWEVGQKLQDNKAAAEIELSQEEFDYCVSVFAESEKFTIQGLPKYIIGQTEACFKEAVKG